MNTSDPDFPKAGAFNWRAVGYSFQLDSSISLDIKSTDPWIVFLSLFGEAKLGNFSNMNRAVDCMLAASDWVLLRAAAEVLGDAGSPNHLRSAHKQLRKLIYEDEETDIQVEFCRSLWCSHYLWVVPVTLEIYLGMGRRERDSEIIPINLRKLLTDDYIPYPEKPGPEDEEFRIVILRHYDELRSKFGSSEVPVLRGNLYSVRRLALDFLAGLKSSDGLALTDFFDYRHRFEAATGIDCSAMFKETMPRPLVATKILEEFLEGPESAKYEDGFRYFWGHRIPD